ncbi:unnamed protein product, partial [Medioppia subpectinata]
YEITLNINKIVSKLLHINKIVSKLLHTEYFTRYLTSNNQQIFNMSDTVPVQHGRTTDPTSSTNPKPKHNEPIYATVNKNMRSNVVPAMNCEEVSRKKEITIVLLGESGVGKSTFINALVNYLSYESLDAANGQPICIIPISFTLTNPTTWEPVKVTLGEHDMNENTDDPTKSATQYPKCYKFEDNNIVVNIIDTPGIGDTAGMDQDNRNMQNILDFISNYREINAFCVLLKPNEARLDVLFNAANNIIFLFTNSRSTHYMPGDSGPALMSILEQIRERPPNVDIPYNENTIYCFDSESFRYLVASVPPNNIEFDSRFKSTYIESWDRSAKECQRLFEYILQLTPHKVMDTLSLNNAKQIIQLLIKPLADITKNIADNVKQCETHKRRIKAEPGIVTKQNIPNEPKTVPAHHNTTRVKSVALTATAANGQELEMHGLDERIAELNAESETIINSMAMFACFLVNNALTACPDAFDDYVRHLVDSQADGTDADSRATIDRLEQLLNNYRHKKQTIIDNLPDGAVITAENVNECVEKLSMMTINGHLFRTMLNTELQTKVKNHVVHNEIIYNALPNTSYSLSKLFCNE